MLVALKNRITEINAAQNPSKPQPLWVRLTRLGLGVVLVCSTLFLVHEQCNRSVPRIILIAVYFSLGVFGILQGLRGQRRSGG